MSEFESVLDSLGSFGPFQIQVFILVSLMETPAAWAMLLPVFIGAAPEWWCSANSSSLQKQDGLSVNQSHVNLLKTCEVSGEQCQEFSYDKSFTSIVSEFQLVCDRSYVSDLITTLQMVGLLIGATVGGQLADIFGRKKVLFCTYFTMIVFGFTSAFADSWVLYAAIRLLVGTSLGGLLVVNFVLPLEYVGMKWRAFCGCIGFWAVGVATLPLWAYFVREWRHLCIATSCASVPLLILWWFIPESCRWLVTRGRYDEAEKIIVAMAQRNKKPVPDFELLRSFAKSDADIKSQQRKFSYWHLCQTPKAALWTFICMYGWFASSSVYYGVSYNLKNLSGDRYLNVFYSGVVEIPALILVLIISNRIGRRWTIFSLFLISGLSLLSIMLVKWLAMEQDTAVLILVLLGKSAIAGGWAAVQVFSAEQFPTLIRNIGIGACAMSARVGGIAAPKLVFLHEYSAQLPFIVFGAIALTCAIVTLFMEETANKPLQDKLKRSHAQADEEKGRSPSPDHPQAASMELVEEHKDTDPVLKEQATRL